MKHVPEYTNKHTLLPFAQKKGIILSSKELEQLKKDCAEFNKFVNKQPFTEI